MSDEAPTPPKPTKKTSAVPLKKETVRVTLKAPDTATPPPSAAPAPSAPSAPAAAAPSAPPAPKPMAPPTASAPAASAAPAPAPAPTVALKTASAPLGSGAPAPAPTVALRTGAAPASSPLKTQPLTGTGTTQLPKATVPLGGSPQLGAAPGLGAGTGTIAGFDEEEDEGNPTITTVLSIFALLAACGALVFQFTISKTWADASDKREFSDVFSLE